MDVRWRLLHKLSGWAALVAALLFRRNLAEEILLLRGIIHSGPQAFPGSAADWFTLLRTHPLIGLTFLNLFDMVNYALVVAQADGKSIQGSDFCNRLALRRRERISDAEEAIVLARGTLSSERT